MKNTRLGRAVAALATIVLAVTAAVASAVPANASTVGWYGFESQDGDRMADYWLWWDGQRYLTDRAWLDATNDGRGDSYYVSSGSSESTWVDGNQDGTWDMRLVHYGGQTLVHSNIHGGQYWRQDEHGSWWRNSWYIRDDASARGGAFSNLMLELAEHTGTAAW